RAEGASKQGGLVNTNVIRTVDLQGLPYVREQIGVVVQNEHASKVYKTYTVVLEADKAKHLSQISVHERKSGVALDVAPEAGQADHAQKRFRATLRRGLQPGEKLSLNVDIVLASVVEPRPAAVGQTEDQQWRWADRALVASTYPTRKQKTVVRTRGDIRRFTQAAHNVTATKDGRNAVTFGPYSATTGGVAGPPVEILFRDNAEQLDALTHRREYFVSHWASDLNVLEHYAVRNRGPKADGGFDKVDQMVAKYMSRRDNLVKTLLVKVPADARELYVVDEIGNVSTSAVSGQRRASAREESFKVLQLRPRYPLAGGWKYTWWHGYSLPLDRYLKVSAGPGNGMGRHLLRVPFIGSLAACASQENELTVAMANAQNTAVRDYELRVTLPEGARDVQVRLPPTVNSGVNEGVELQSASYFFDSVGRTTVVVRQANVAPELATKHILISYSYSALALWLKPAVVAALLFALFMLTLAVSRMHEDIASVRVFFWASIALTWVLSFVQQNGRRNYSIVDRLWSVFPLLLVAQWMYHATVGLGLDVSDKALTAVGLVTVWSVRLTFNALRRGDYAWGAEDYRWAHVRKAFDRALDSIGIGRHVVVRVVVWETFNLLFISVFQLALLYQISVPVRQLILSSPVDKTPLLSVMTLSKYPLYRAYQIKTSRLVPCIPLSNRQVVNLGHKHQQKARER
ncbi:dolichyl-diphosphooligosaccharide--protein glycosyltransferase subunit 1, partial [Coemansia sp. RSA 2320]